MAFSFSKAAETADFTVVYSTGKPDQGRQEQWIFLKV